MLQDKERFLEELPLGCEYYLSLDHLYFESVLDVVLAGCDVVQLDGIEDMVGVGEEGCAVEGLLAITLILRPQVDVAVIVDLISDEEVVLGQDAPGDAQCEQRSETQVVLLVDCSAVPGCGGQLRLG
jgi:hypothetical protein